MDQQHQLKKHNSNEGEKESRSAATHFASDTTQLKAAAITPPLSSAVPAQMKPVSYGETQDAEADLLPGDTMQLMASGDEGESPSPPSEESNNNGLPDQLKAGIESLSGISMDDVRVNYNSSKPAAMNARAYAKGSDIHLGAGQEEHLAHEAWHVVQQKQGRVKPTVMKKSNIPVNDDKGLEREADVMGGKALASGNDSYDKETLKKGQSSSSVHQLVGQRLELVVGAEAISEAEAAALGRTGIVIEVMIQNNNEGIINAEQKIEQLADQSDSSLNICIAIGLNTKKGSEDEDKLSGHAASLAAFASELKVKCAIVPMTWKMPPGGGKGYVFPFLEAREALGQHSMTKKLRKWASAGTKSVVVPEGEEGGVEVVEGAIEEAVDKEVYHRTMDADVSDDPLLGAAIVKDEGLKNGKPVKKPKKGYKPGTKMRENPEKKAERIAARNANHEKVNSALTNHKKGPLAVVTGGYNWETSDLDAGSMKARLINELNGFEHLLRKSAELSMPESLYMPEPNTYINESIKDTWDRGLLDQMDDPKVAKVQMGESMYGRKAITADNPVVHDKEIATTKPRKDWLDNLDPLIAAMEEEIQDDDKIGAEFDKVVNDIHQSYLKTGTAEKIASGHGSVMNGKKQKKLQKFLDNAKPALREKVLAIT